MKTKVRPEPRRVPDAGQPNGAPVDSPGRHESPPECLRPYPPKNLALMRFGAAVNLPRE